jgi:SAM-dependent methyltransferase
MPPFLTSIKEAWVRKLALKAVPFLLLFSLAIYFMLPLRLAAVPKITAALVLGSLLGDLLLARQKKAHLRRHIDEARFLGFTCSLRGNPWNPFSVPELELRKEPADPALDRMLANLAQMRGPHYSNFTVPLRYGAELAVLSQVFILLLARALPSLTLSLIPVFGLGLFVFGLSKADMFLEKLEYTLTRSEMFCFRDSDAGYYQWNFLDLESKRQRKGVVEQLRLEIADILLRKAGLKSGAAVLEVGAGGGFLWKNLPEGLRDGWIQVEKNAHAGLYAQKHGYGKKFYNCDVKNMPLPAGSFDAIAGLECFDSLSGADLLAFLPEAKRLLKPGGKLVHLKDFPDWPGESIAEKFNAFSMKVINKKTVVYGAGYTFRWFDITAEELSSLREAAGKEAPTDRPWAKTLAVLCSAESRADSRFRVPMLVSVLILKEIFTANGFLILTDCLERQSAQGVLAYLIAQKNG